MAGIDVSATSDIGAIANLGASVVNVAGEGLKVVGQVDAEKNTPAMVQNDQAKKIQAFKDKSNALIARAEAGDKDAQVQLEQMLS